MPAATILLPWQHLGHPPKIACQTPGSLQAFTLSEISAPPREAPCTTPASCPPSTKGAVCSPAGQKPQSSARKAGKGMAEAILHLCRKATLTQRHHDLQQNTDLQEEISRTSTSSPDENLKRLKPQEGLCTPKSCYQASA